MDLIYLPGWGFIRRDGRSGGRRIKGKPSAAELTDTEKLRSYCSINPNDFACTVNYNHSPGTMNPIGGGVGYLDVVTSGDYTVTDKATFVTALASASGGETIYFDPTGTFDFTGEQYEIPTGVTLASNRGSGTSQGALITVDDGFTISSGIDDHTFITGGTGVRFTGLRIRGPDKETTSYVKQSNGIRAVHGDLEVDNCMIEGFYKWGIHLHVNKDHFIHHNYIRYNRETGFGYGIWCSGATVDDPKEYVNSTNLYANYLEECRHEIASSSRGDSSYKAYYNLQVDHQFAGNHPFDRHSGGGVAGYITDIQYNMFYDRSKTKGIIDGFEALPDNSGTITFANNYTNRGALTGDTNMCIDTDDAQYVTGDTTGNIFSGAWISENQPTVTITSDSDSVVAGGNITFTATGTDPTGNHVINAYYWYENGLRDMSMTSDFTFTKTFSTAGTYTVSVRARNRAGILSELQSKTIWVKATAGESAIKDKLVEWWDFSEASGNKTGSHSSYVLTESGTPPVITGKNGNGVHITGTNGLILGSSSFKEFNPYNDDFTMALWIKPISLSEGNFSRILITSSNDRNEFFLSYDNSGGINYRVYDNWGNGGAYTRSTASPITLNNWHLLIIEAERDFDADTLTRRFFVDNPTNEIHSEAITMNSTKTSIYNTTGQLIFGTTQFGGTIGNYHLDSFGFWKRKLTQSERLSVWNNGDGITYAGL